MNENRRNKVLTMIKQLKMREYSVHADFLLNCYVLVFFFILTLPPSLTSFILYVGWLVVAKPQLAVVISWYIFSQYLL